MSTEDVNCIYILGNGPVVGCNEYLVSIRRGKNFDSAESVLANEELI